MEKWHRRMMAAAARKKKPPGGRAAGRKKTENMETEKEIQSPWKKAPHSVIQMAEGDPNGNGNR